MELVSDHSGDEINADLLAHVILMLPFALFSSEDSVRATGVNFMKLLVLYYTLTRVYGLLVYLSLFHGEYHTGATLSTLYPACCLHKGDLRGNNQAV